MALTHRRPRVGIELSENYKTALTSQFLISVFDHSDDRGLGHGQRQGPKVIKRAKKHPLSEILKWQLKKHIFLYLCDKENQ